MLGSFGASWSNTNFSQNDIMQSFKFTAGDIVRITFDQINE